jgi:hypothetical protein
MMQTAVKEGTISTSSDVSKGVSCSKDMERLVVIENHNK